MRVSSILATTLAAAVLGRAAPQPEAPAPGIFTGTVVAWNLTAASEPVACGAFRTGDAKNLWNIAWDCKFGRGSNFEVPRKDSFTVKGTKCFRIACWNTSGIYVCNDNSEDRTVGWFEAGQTAMTIITGCCPISRWHPQNHYAVSGMLGLESAPRVNVIAAYGSCEAPDDIRPGDYEGWGPNGACL